LTRKNIHIFINEFSPYLTKNKAVLLDEIKTKIVPTEIFLFDNHFLLGAALPNNQIAFLKNCSNLKRKKLPLFLWLSYYYMNFVTKKKLSQRYHPNYKTPEAIKTFQDEMESGCCVELAIFGKYVEVSVSTGFSVDLRVFEIRSTGFPRG